MASERAPRARARAWLLIVVATCCVGCGSSVRRFPLAAPLWQDPDRNHVPKRPKKFFSGLYADAIDQTFLWPAAQALALTQDREALNVNALDELPNSSWFTNRIGLRPMSPEEAARGPCTEAGLDPARGPWLITAAKTEGVTPGFFIEAPDGHRYLLKVDSPFRPERATAADVIGSRIYWAAGYFTPCNEIVYFDRNVLALAPDATAENLRGQKTPLTADDVRTVLSKAAVHEGKLRGVASRFVPGIPLGPHPFSGVRKDDPNDVIPHEDRRDLRAERLIAAWLNHFDVREQNSLDVLVNEQGRQYVRHYQLDFGDSFGGPWVDERLNRRIGYSYVFDLWQILVDFFTLGALPRPWFRSRVNPEVEIFGHYGWQDFVASRWRAVYPNPAYLRMTWRDALWMTRIVARFTDEHLRAIVATAKFSNPRYARYLTRALVERRDRLLREYLLHEVPLDRFVIPPPEAPGVAPRLCFEDLAIRYLDVPAGRVVYKLRLLGGPELQTLLGWQQLQPAAESAGLTCIQLPFQGGRPSARVPPDAPDNHPARYVVIKIAVQQQPSLAPTFVRLHAYDLGPRRGLVLVGVERLRAGSERGRPEIG